MKKPSPEIEEYLELLVRFKDKNKKAKTSEIAKKLKIAPASVTEMFRKLEKKGLIKHTKYKGAELTKKGEELGRRVLKKHRLIEKFLLLLGIKKDKIHDEACILEHALSDEVEDALKKAMKNPDFPEISNQNIKRLSELKQGQSGKVLFLIGGSGACRRLSEMGLTLNTKVTLVRKSNFGPLGISIRGSTVAIGRGLSEKVYVEIEA